MTRDVGRKKRVGIFSGTFDPVHDGHIAFALEAAKVADLDMVYFAPEVKPRNKPHVTHIAHRVAMLELAVRDHASLGVVEIPGKYFMPQTTMTHIVKSFPDAEISLLFGADVFSHLVNFTDQWPYVEGLLSRVELIVSERCEQGMPSLQKEGAKLKYPSKKIWFTKGQNLNVSSKIVRDSLSEGLPASNSPSSVLEYAKKNWLYHDIVAAKKISK